ncbi:MAG: hypothetical protein HYX68_11135 [Planctomycetes bacterium]|nr:hypothetical protein [Planctomycetota bacterium]
MRLAQLCLIGVLSITVTSPLVAATNAAEIMPAAQVPGAGVHGTYEVLYRHDHHDRWHTYGHYHSDHRAHDVADDLRHQGYQVRVHHHF